MRSISDDQADVYLHRAEEYDQLVSAEDADGHLEALLHRSVSRGVIADIGAGTGRVTRLLAGHIAHSHLVERAAPMLEVAKRMLGDVSFETHLADARALPLADQSVDAAIAGWVFAHFRHWMPDGWRAEVNAALAEMTRVTRPGGLLLVIETLGTGHETPRTHAALDEYFAHLEAQGFERQWVRTDYVFADVEQAARVCGAFFGETMAAEIRARGSERVPECTGVWSRSIAPLGTAQ